MSNTTTPAATIPAPFSLEGDLLETLQEVFMDGGAKALQAAAWTLPIEPAARFNLINLCSVVRSPREVAQATGRSELVVGIAARMALLTTLQLAQYEV